MIEETQALITNTFCSKDWMNIFSVYTAYIFMRLAQTTVGGTSITDWYAAPYLLHAAESFLRC